MSSEYDRLISICWRNCTDNATLTGGEIRHFISEIQTFLGIDHLLDVQETELLRKLIVCNPKLQLHREEAVQFLLRLAACSSMEQLLARSKLSISDIDRIVNDYPRRGTQIETKPQYRDLFQNTHYSKAYRSGSDYSRAYTPSDANVALGTKAYESRKAYTDSAASHLADTTPEGDHTLYQRIKNTTLSFFPSSLRGNADSSRKEYAPRADVKVEEEYLPRSFYSSSSDVTALKEKILKLERQCQRYEADRLDRTSGTRVQDLKKAISDQDAVIDRLEQKIRLKYPSTERQPWRLPSFVLSYAPKLENIPFSSSLLSNPFMNMAFLIVVAVLILNVLKLIFFIALLILQNRPQLHIDDYYDDVVTINFSWLQEFPWLEYKVYQFKEWAGY